MEEFKNIIKFLYSSFLLRDLAGKVVPGAVILFTTVISLDISSYIGLSNNSFKPEFQLGVWVILFLFCWVIGLAAQSIGRGIRVVHYSFEYPSVDDFHEVLRIFRDLRKDDKNALERLERFMAIREAYGNGAAATLVALILGLLLFFAKSSLLTGIGIIVFFVSFFALWLGYNKTIRNQDSLEVLILILLLLLFYRISNPIVIIAIVSFIALKLGHDDTVRNLDSFISTHIFTRFKVTGQSLEKLENLIPKEIINGLKSMRNIEYKSEEQFVEALKKTNEEININKFMPKIKTHCQLRPYPKSWDK